jgi:hypothetical protein
MQGSAYCVGHDPDQAAARRRRAARGGRSGGRGRPTTELKKIQHRLEELADMVLEGEVDRVDAAVAGRLMNYARACVRDSLAARDQEELIERMEALEEAVARQKQDPYGA